MRMVIINNRPWAVGLDWSSTRVEKLSRQRLLEKAQKIDPSFDMMAVQRRLYGFGSSGGQTEQWKNVRSLAAFIQLPPSFLGLFALEDIHGETFWWIIGRQNGQNVGQGDAVYVSRHEAEVEMKSLNELLDNSISEMVIQEDPAQSLAWLEPLLRVGVRDMLRKRGGLESLTEPPRRMSFAVPALCVLVLAVGWYGVDTWLTRRAEQASLEASRLAGLKKEQRRQELLAHPEKYFEQSWTKVPLAHVLAKPCLDALLLLPTVANGWQLAEASCAGRAVSIRWEHRSQTADFLHLPYNARLESPQVAVSRSTLAVRHTPRSGQPFSGLLTREHAMRHLYQLTQQTGTKLRLAFRAAETRIIDKVELTAPWIKGEWELHSVPGSLLSDEAFWGMLALLPGLTLERISMKGSSWGLQGSVYAREK